jgi:hypothetical protein
MKGTGKILSLIHSNDKQSAYISMTSINILFVATLPLQIQIKYAMKSSAPIKNKSIIPSLFQIAARVEDFAHVITSKSAPPLNQTSFADLMLHPEKLEAALKTATSENDAFNTVRVFSQRTDKHATRSATPKIRNGGNAGKSSNLSLIEPKRTEFHLLAPFAKSVKLAADFTNWEKSPIDLIKSEDGVWHTVIPLPPGHYLYRFIVDGRWCDDLHLALREPNPFGTTNAVVNVT